MYHKYEVDQLARAVAPSTRGHWTRLGFRTREDYIVWRWKRGLCAGYELSWSEKFSEMGTLLLEFEQRRACERYKASPEAFVRGVCSGRIQHWSLHDTPLAVVAEAIQLSGLEPVELASLAEFLGPLAARCSDFVFARNDAPARGPIVRNLILLHDYRPYWVRDPDDWVPEGENPDVNVRSLARHLFDRYGDAPAFLETAWLRSDAGSAAFREWYVHIGRGGSLREVELPLPLTRRMLHRLRGALRGWTIEQALRWAQASGLGVPDPLAWAVAGSRLGRTFDPDHFWISFLTWLRDTPEVEPAAVGPLVDYIYAQKFDAVILQAEGGGAVSQPPPQPGFSMRGRSFEGLCRGMTDWHLELDSRRHRYCWFPEAPSEWLEFGVKVEEGAVRWTARRVRDTLGLCREGREMNNCIATYNDRCARGDVSVWSMVRDGASRKDCRLSVMLDRDGRLVEARGWANRPMTGMETEAVHVLAREIRRAGGESP